MCRSLSHVWLIRFFFAYLLPFYTDKGGNTTGRSSGGKLSGVDHRLYMGVINNRNRWWIKHFIWEYFEKKVADQTFDIGTILETGGGSNI